MVSGAFKFHISPALLPALQDGNTKRVLAKADVPLRVMDERTLMLLAKNIEKVFGQPLEEG